VDPVPDPLLLRKSGSAGDRTRDLCICSQKLWPLDHRGGLTLALSKVFVEFPIWLFFLGSSLISWIPVVWLRYCLSDFEMVPVDPVFTGNTFTFHMLQISVVWSLHFRIFSASFLITFLSPEIATFFNIRVRFALSRIMMSGSLLGMVLTLPFWFHNVVTSTSC